LFTSSQEDSLAKHMENINLSSSTPLTNKEITTFGENNPDTYDKSFGLAGITYPAAPDDLIHLAGSIQGNYKLEKTVWPALMSISPDDFRPLGRFAHIFIPKYVYVPKEVFTYLNIQLPKGTPAYHLTWQFCYAARQEANKWTEGSEITKSTSHWIDILLDPKATNNIQFNTIDIIQAEAAQKWKITMLKTERDPYVWYDMFIRPVEIIFARKTALHGKLNMAMRCQQQGKVDNPSSRRCHDLYNFYTQKIFF
jgi:hypothetical protein